MALYRTTSDPNVTCPEDLYSSDELERMDQAADLALVESFCVEKMKYDRATEFLETSGLKKPGDMLDSTNKGNTKMVSLYIKIQDQALANMIKISSRFGFDPVSRTSIGASEVKNDPLSDLI